MINLANSGQTSSSSSNVEIFFDSGKIPWCIDFCKDGSTAFSTNGSNLFFKRHTLLALRPKISSVSLSVKENLDETKNNKSLSSRVTSLYFPPCPGTFFRSLLDNRVFSACSQRGFIFSDKTVNCSIVNPVNRKNFSGSREILANRNILYFFRSIIKNRHLALVKFCNSKLIIIETRKLQY